MPAVLWHLLTALIFATALPGCIVPIEITPGPQADGSVVVVVPLDKVKACAAEGGCGIFSTARIAEMQQEAFAAGARVMCKRKEVML